MPLTEWITIIRSCLALTLGAVTRSSAIAAKPPQVSGSYPHLARLNEAGNCGMCKCSEAVSSTVRPGRKLEHTLPDALDAYSLRLVPDKDTTATALFTYE